MVDVLPTSFALLAVRRPSLDWAVRLNTTENLGSGKRTCLQHVY